MISCNQVTPGKNIIWIRLARPPIKGIQGAKGTLKGLCREGCLYRRINTPKQTMANTSNVPIETSCPKIPTGKSPAINIAAKVMRIVEKRGVCVFL